TRPEPLMAQNRFSLSPRNLSCLPTCIDFGTPGRGFAKLCAGSLRGGPARREFQLLAGCPDYLMESRKGDTASMCKFADGG
ncbi:MAG: hypothetical protein OXN84_06025, partial [Albidovulum sp.]|nr:hypothetical protein [Albidovulum sp.]